MAYKRTGQRSVRSPRPKSRRTAAAIDLPSRVTGHRERNGSTLPRQSHLRTNIVPTTARVLGQLASTFQDLRMNDQGFGHTFPFSIELMWPCFAGSEPAAEAISPARVVAPQRL